MKKVIVGLVALVVAAVAAYLLMAPKAVDPKLPSPATVAAPQGTKTTTSENSNYTSLRPPTEGKRGVSGPTTPPPPGTLRPPNPAEIALEARLKRPFNKYNAQVGSWWGQASRLVEVGDPQLSKDIRARGSEMADLVDLNDDQLKLDEVLAKEEVLLQRLQGAANTTELKAICQYIEESLKVTREGGDPSTVVRPTIP